MRNLRRFLSNETAQDLVEYSLLISLVVLGSVGVMYSSGGSIAPVWNTANNALSGNPQTSSSPSAPTSSGGGSTTGTGTGTRHHDDR